jgi:hypothetical protein
MVDDGRDREAFVGRLGGWSAVKSRRQKGERVISDERVLGHGEFVARVLEEAEESVRHQLPSEQSKLTGSSSHEIRESTGSTAGSRNFAHGYEKVTLTWQSGSWE